MTCYRDVKYKNIVYNIRTSDSRKINSINNIYCKNIICIQKYCIIKIKWAFISYEDSAIKQKSAELLKVEKCIWLQNNLNLYKKI